MVPFRLEFLPGVPLHEQVSFAAKKAMMAGRLRPGDPFPSVRTLSREFRIHVNTAQRVVAALTQEGLLEVRPGIGTVVCQPPPPPRRERTRILGPDIEQLVVEARRLGLTLDDLHEAIAERWRRLQSSPSQEVTRP